MNLKTALPWLIMLSAPSTALLASTLDLRRTDPVPDSAPIPVIDFFRAPLLSEPKLNPAGTHIAALIAADQDRRQLLVYDLRTQTMEAKGGMTDHDVYGVDWLGDKRVIYYMGGYDYVADVGAVFDSRRISGANLIADPPADRTHPLMLFLPGWNDRDFSQAVNVNTDGAGTILKYYPVLRTNHGFDLNYWADKDGQLKLGITSQDGLLTLHQLQGDNWETCPENLEEIEVFGCGDNPSDIVVLGPREGGKPRALETMTASTGKVTEILLQDPGYDFDGWLYHDPVSHDIVGAIYNRQGPHVVWFTPSYRNLQKIVDHLFPGKVVRILGTNDAGNVVLLAAFSDRQPTIYSWANLEKHTAGLIKNSAPWIDSQRMRPMSPIKFKTRDGHELDAYLTMPAGGSKQHLPPLVVLPHRELGERDSWGYNGEVQFLASRGYAVLQPNFRGSAGYGWMFPVEDDWAFRKMHDDVTDATKTVAASGLIDRDRIAIIGTSFGGYLALCGVAFEPNLYRCAVAISAVPDWADVIGDNKHSKNSNFRYTRLLKKLGDPKLDRAKFDAMSPLRHADQIRAPILSVRAESDYNAAGNDSKSIAATLERNHIPAESIFFPNEGGGVYWLDHKIELYTRIEAFLGKYLAPAAATP